MTLPFRRVFDYRLLKPRHIKTLQIAFSSCPFDFSRLRPGLNELFDGGRILIKPGGMSPGLYKPETAVCRVRFIGEPWFKPEQNAASFLHEVGGHALDLLTFTSETRTEIYKALHGGQEPTGIGTVVYPSWGWKVHDPRGPMSDHGHDWFDTSYHEGVAEAYAEAFVAAMSTLPAGAFPAHPYTPEALARIREILAGL